MIDEVVTKELKAVFVRMDDLGLGRMQREATFGRPDPHLFQSRFGFFPRLTLNHQVIGVCRVISYPALAIRWSRSFR